jgi:hypothetical protein
VLCPQSFFTGPANILYPEHENTELLLLHESVPGKRYIVETVTTTSAPYGDKFTLILQYILVSDGLDASYCFLTFTIQFIDSVPMMLRPVVGSVIRGGWLAGWQAV